MMVEPYRYKEVIENKDRQLAAEYKEKLVTLNKRLHSELDELIRMCSDALKLSMPSSPKYFTVEDTVIKVSRRFIGWRNVGCIYYYSISNPTVGTIREVVRHQKILLNAAKYKELAEASLHILKKIATSDLLEDIVLSSSPFKIKHVFSWEEFNETCGSRMTLICYASPWRYSVVSIGLYPVGQQVHSPSSLIGISPTLVHHAYFFLDLFKLYNTLLKTCIKMMEQRLKFLEELKKRLERELAIVKKFVALQNI